MDFILAIFVKTTNLPVINALVNVLSYTAAVDSIIVFFCLLHVLFLLSSALFMIGTCSAFFVIIADLAPVVFAWVTSVPPDAPYLRIVILFSLAVSIIFPLSLLRQLDSLSSLSTASLGFYAWLTIQVRCYINFYSKSSSLFSRSQLIIYALQKVGASDFSLWKTSGILHTVPIYAMSFSCHL